METGDLPPNPLKQALNYNTRTQVRVRVLLQYSYISTCTSIVIQCLFQYMTTSLYFQMEPVFAALPHQRVLQQKYTFLVENVAATDVIDHIYQEGWISQDEKENIDETRGERMKTRKLLDGLIKKPRAAFDVLLYALSQTNTDHVVQALNDKLAEIHQDEGEQHKLVE